MEETREINDLDLPIAILIRSLISDLSDDQKNKLFKDLSEDEFIILRVKIYLDELTKAISAGYDELGAKEIAHEESLEGLQ